MRRVAAKMVRRLLSDVQRERHFEVGYFIMTTPPAHTALFLKQIWTKNEMTPIVSPSFTRPVTV